MQIKMVKSRIMIILFVTLALCFGCSAAASAFSEDISVLAFNSLSIESSPQCNNLTFGVYSRKASRFEGIIDVKKAAQKSIEYFFTVLALSDDKFWVNLNPNEKDKAIDPFLADTDFGRVMLAADLRLKEDFSELTNPQASPIGKEFWKRLHEKAGELGIGNEVSAGARVWIVPEEAGVYETTHEVRLTESRLKVCIEGDMPEKDSRQKDFQGYAYSLMKEMIVPFLNLKVNEGYAYAQLRQAYSSLLLARWYKNKFNSSQNPLLQTINPGTLKEASLDSPYTSEEIYRDYLISFSSGAYSSKETMGDNKSRQYTSGGINWAETVFLRKSKAPDQEGEGKERYVCRISLPRAIVNERPLRYARSNFSLLEQASVLTPPLVPSPATADELSVLSDILPPIGPDDLKYMGEIENFRLSREESAFFTNL